jgi:hypothetical protein
MTPSPACEERRRAKGERWAVVRCSTTFPQFEFEMRGERTSGPCGLSGDERTSAATDAAVR